VEISKAIDRDILDIEIHQLLKNKSEDKQLESEIRKIIETKYNDEAIKGMIESELDSLEISKMMSESNKQFNRGNIEPILKKKYNKEKLIREETAKIRLTLLLQDDRLDLEREKALREKLKEKYKDDHIEEYYEARGYKSASSWFVD
jgi:hypothetical protein